MIEKSVIQKFLRQGNIVAKRKLKNVLQVPLLYVGRRVGEDQLTMLVRETEILR